MKKLLSLFAALMCATESWTQTKILNQTKLNQNNLPKQTQL